MPKLNLKVIIISVSIFLLLFFLSSIIMYSCKFGCKLSYSKEAWGQFGDFIGGFTNPLIGIANVIVVSYLAYEISQFEQNQKEKDRLHLEMERKNEIRFIGLKEFNSYYFNTAKLISKNNIDNLSQRIEITIDCISLINLYKLFFDSLNKTTMVNIVDNYLANPDKLEITALNKLYMDSLLKILREMKDELFVIDNESYEKKVRN